MTILTLEEFVSLLIVDNSRAVTNVTAVIPAEHSARLIALIYGARVRQAVGDQVRQVADSNGI
jgi:hypothetical protein